MPRSISLQCLVLPMLMLVIVACQCGLMAQPGSLYAPANGLFTQDTVLVLSWNSAPTATNYEVEIDTTVDFADPLDQFTITADSIEFTATANQSYFWRVFTHYGTSTDTSQTFQFTTVNLAQLGGLELWLRADSGTALDGNGFLAQWQGQGPAGITINQNNSALRPNYVDDPSVFSTPVIRFDGNNDVLNIPNPLTSPFNLYAISKHDPSGNPLQAFLATYGVTSIPAGKFCLFYQGASGARFRTNGVTDAASSFDNSNFVLLHASSELPGTIELSSNESSPGVTNNHNTNFDNTSITVGGPNISDRIFKGDLSEILLFSEKQSDTLASKIRKFLYHKNAPPITLGPDHIKNGYCPVNLEVPNRYKTYAWNTGDTTNAIQVTHSGTYNLTVTDFFGHQYADTVLIEFLEEPSPVSNDTTICGGNMIDVKIGNVQSSYDVIWSDGTLGDSISISEQGVYSYQITDNNGCVFQSDSFQVTVDSFSLLDLFPNDTTLCEGNRLIAEGLEGTLPTWNTGSNDTFISVVQDGAYWITSENDNQCIATDTVIVTINGQSPIAKFSADSSCVHTAVEFKDSSFAVDQSNVVSWTWDFGDGSTSSSQHPVKVYDTSGTFDVRLEIDTDSGCTEFTIQPIYIAPEPEVNIETAPLDSSCLGTEVVFQANYNGPSANALTTWDWSFGDGGVSNDSQPVHTYTATGDYTIQLNVETALGCVTDIQTNFSVFESAGIETPDLSTYYPGNGFLLFDSTLSFKWNLDEFFYAYHLEVATDPSMQNVVVSETIQQQDSVIIDFSPFQKNDTLYWQLTGYTYCNDTIRSNVKYMVLFEPSQVNDLSLWLKSELNVQTDANGNVTQWEDARSNGKLAVQGNSSNRPYPNTNPPRINAAQTIEFDGANDDMILPISMDTLQSLLVFYRQLPGGSSLQSLLGTQAVTGIDAGYFNFFSNNNSRFTFRTNSTNDTYVITDNTEFNIAQVNTISNSAHVIYNNKDSEASSGHNTNFNNDNIILAGPTGSFQRVLKGEVIEVFAFSSIPPAGDIDKLVKYFQYKYYPPIHLGKNVRRSNNFCSTELGSERPWFTNYKWSNGSTTPTISVQKSGNYSVTVTDILGNESMDTVKVTYPGHFISDTALCQGDTLSWDLGLSPGEYNIMWHDSTMNSMYSASQEQEISVQISDNMGCTLLDTIHLDIDSFALQATLGPDTTLCNGNALELSVGKEKAQSYLWSTGSQNAEAIVDGAGDYAVTVTDTNGCVATDTVTVAINGTVPEVDFTTNSLCMGDTATFIDNSSAAGGDALSAWEWTIVGSKYSGTTASYHFPDSGRYEVQLEVSTQAGCTDRLTEMVFVNPLPVIGFNQSQLCHAVPVNFTDQSEAYNAFMADWQWDFGDGDTSAVRNPSHIYDIPGNYDITLVAGSNEGCYDTLTKTLLVRGSPIANFGAEDGCTGEIVAFSDSSDDSQSSAIINWSWDFGDNTNSNQRNPNHLYQEPGMYEVTQTVQATNGCSTDTTKTVTVYQAPEAAFGPDSICAGAAITFIDSSDAFNDTITSYQWNLENGPTLDGPAPTHTYDNSGTYQVTLQVENSVGCAGTTTRPLRVAPVPEADFSFDPPFGASPIDITMDNNTAGSVQSHWRITDSLGNTVYATTEHSPEYAFTENGEFTVRLITVNGEGCADTLWKTLVVAEPLLDVWVQDFFVDQQLLNDGTYSIGGTVRLHNTGTRIINSVALYAYVDNGGTLIDNWSGTLAPGQSTLHTLGSRFFVSGLDEQAYVCVEARFVNGEPDEVPANDILCEPLSDIIRVVPPYPSPANEQITFEIITPGEAELLVEVFDETGKRQAVISNTPASQGLNRFELDAGRLAEGLYFVRVMYREVQYVEKFAVQR